MAGARRGRGEGSIFQRADGKWGCAVSAGYTKDGKRRRKVILGNSKEAVQKELAKLQIRTPGALAADAARLTVEQYLGQWLETDAKARCRERTLENHQRVVKRELVPNIGRLMLSKLSATDIQLMVSEMPDADRAAYGRNDIRKTLNRALNRAVRLGLLQQNPCALVETARLPHKTLSVLSPEEVARFFAAAKGDRLHALYVLAVTSGLRQGELFGLHWSDIDLDAGALVVQRALDRNGKFSDPKTVRARRRVDLPKMAVAALKVHAAAMCSEGHGSLIVFCDRIGHPLRPSNVARGSFKVLLKAAGLPDIRFHDLRHSHASLLLLQGENPKVVQERLGHAKIELTLGTYSHLLPGIQRAAADRLNVLLMEAQAGASK